MKFECQESCGGQCCTPSWGPGSTHFVFLTKSDQEKIEDHTGIPLEGFANQGVFEWTRFTTQQTTQWYLKGDDQGCMFFKDGKCGIYEARPTQCRTFPFWPEYMNPESWKKIGEICPGIDASGDTAHVETPQDFIKALDQMEADLELGEN